MGRQSQPGRFNLLFNSIALSYVLIACVHLRVHLNIIVQLLLQCIQGIGIMTNRRLVNTRVRQQEREGGDRD